MENKTPNAQPEMESIASFKWKPFTAEDFDGLVRSGDIHLIASMGSDSNSLGSRVYEAIADAANARLASLIAALEALATAVEYDGDDEGLGQYTAITSVLAEYQKLVRE